MADRMAYNAAGVTATVIPCTSLTLQAVNGAPSLSPVWPMVRLPSRSLWRPEHFVCEPGSRSSGHNSSAGMQLAACEQHSTYGTSTGQHTPTLPGMPPRADGSDRPAARRHNRYAASGPVPRGAGPQLHNAPHDYGLHRHALRRAGRTHSRSALRSLSGSSHRATRRSCSPPATSLHQILGPMLPPGDWYDPLDETAHGQPCTASRQVSHPPGLVLRYPWLPNHRQCGTRARWGWGDPISPL